MAKKIKSKKAARAKLEKGAAKIKAAEAEAKKVEPIAEKELVTLRPMAEIVKDRVTLLPSNIGLRLADETTMAESLVVLDWTKQMSDHVGFMIGDVLNFGKSKWGYKYTVAINQTGRAYNSLAHFASVANRIPAEHRQATLSFEHHREIARLGEGEGDGTFGASAKDSKMVEVLRQVGEQAEKGEGPNRKELRFKIDKLTPRKRKKPARVTSGKGKKRARKEVELPPYQPTAEEQSQLDQCEEAFSAAVQAQQEAKLYKIVAKLDNKEKRRWTELVQPLVVFYNAIEKITGY